jgi:hypothetical protein
LSACNAGALKTVISSQGLRPAKFLRAAPLVRSSPSISAAFSFGRKDSHGTIAAIATSGSFFIIETFVAPIQIEKKRCPMPNSRAQRHGYLESDSRGSRKSRFFEVSLRLNQPQSLKARVAVLADDQMIMHGDF